jgi:pimeloyl-ACP methyl ester carboxylesterase
MVPSRLQDMADDGLDLLAALGIERAHVVGASMGGR